MAKITAAMVKELRDMTGVAMMECKKALVEADGDIDAAVDVLRTRGLAAAAKKAGRATNEGTIGVAITEDAYAGAMVEVNCETDFVGTNAKFTGFAHDLAVAAVKSDAADMDALMAADNNGKTVDASLTEAIQVLGENMKIARFTVRKAEQGAVESYIHGGKIGVLVEFAFANSQTAQNDAFKAFAHDVAMQVAAAEPICARRENVPEDVVAHEMEIYKQQAAASGKPEAIQEKIATGRLEKFYRQRVLCEQEFIKDGDITINQYAETVSKECGDAISVVAFDRFVLGETDE